MLVPNSIKEIDSYFERQSNTTTNELLNVMSKQYNVRDVHTLGVLLNYYSSVYVIGDYDVDGIMSTTIMVKYLQSIGKKCTYRIPKRFTEGYGINEVIVDEIEADSLVITVDNGITCVDVVQMLKDKGCGVVIIDHHLPNDRIPDATVIFDPFYSSATFDYKEYCGAGLCYKIVSTLGISDEMKDELLVYAALATVADTVPLTGDNRKIVIKGLELLNAMKAPKSITKLIEALRATNDSIGKITSDTIGYYIAPMLNAPGRLEDDGSQNITLRYILGEIKDPDILIQYNKRRQQEVASIKNDDVKGTNISWIYDVNIHPGVCGIVANNILSDTMKPSFVMTKYNNIVKGSCRSKSTHNIFNALKSCEDILDTYGGHEFAGAFTLKEENLDKFIERLESIVSPIHDTHIQADLVLNPPDAMQLLYRMEEYQPFGEGCRKPLFQLEGDIDRYYIMGKDKNHLKLLISSINCLVWNKAAEYVSKNYPSHAKVIGYLEKNVYQGTVTPQISVKYVEYS